MEVNKVEEREINKIVVEEVLMEDSLRAGKKNFNIPMKRVAGQRGPDVSSDVELWEQFSTVGNRKRK
jgi:hypothetical protein